MNIQDLEFLLILSQQGEIYVHRVFDRSLLHMDKETFSSLFTSLSIFSKQFFGSHFEEITIGNKYVYIKSYPEFQIALSSKKPLKKKNSQNLLEEVGEAFKIQYLDYIKNEKVDISKFDEFGAIIGQIFGIETYIYLEEQEKILNLLDDAIAGRYNERQTIRLILSFLDQLTNYKLEILLDNIGDNLKLIMKDAKDLTKLQKKRYARIL
ncbi:hypothetical protein [Candidatus Harpocratesius sp.]